MTTGTSAPAVHPPVSRTAAHGPVSEAEARGFARPTVLDGLRELAAVIGPQEALAQWSRAAQATGSHGMQLDAAAHERAALWLAGHTASLPARAVAHSVVARIRAHRVLSSRPAGTTTPRSAS
jgi:hypothetical protein